MVFAFLTEIALGTVVETSWWGMKKVYDGGYWMIYGTPETTEEKIMKEIIELKTMKEDGKCVEHIEEKILEHVDELKKQNEELNKYSHEQEESNKNRQKFEEMILKKLEEIKKETPIEKEILEELKELRLQNQRREEDIERLKEKLDSQSEYGSNDPLNASVENVAYFYSLMSQKN